MPDDQNDEQTTDDQGASQSTQGAGDRVAARAAQGLPASIDDLTDEQLHKYIGQPTVEVEAVSAEQVEVLAMQDTGNVSGEAIA